MFHLKSPLISVIIANWNGRHYLADCLTSLAAAPTDHQTIVVDNGSTDGSQEWIRQHFPGMHLIELQRNCGFAGANNTGIRAALQAGAEYVVLLNNDTRVDAQWLEALLAVAQADPTIAMCHAQQRTWDGQFAIQFQFIPEWAEAEMIHRPVGNPPPPAPCAFASGCALLLRGAALQKIGLFDERYFMYVEDVDLALRAWIAGYRVMFVPSAIVYHHIGGSQQGGGNAFLGYRNQLTTILKLYEWTTLRRFARPIIQRWFLTRNRTALRASLASLVLLPSTLKLRRRIQRGRVAPDRVFLDLG